MDKDRRALESVLEALELDALIRQIELPGEKPLEAALKELKQHGQLLTRAGKPDGRRAAGKARAKKNARRRAKAREQQRWRRSWNERKLQEALDGNHYAYLEGRWRRKKRPFAFSEAQWLDHVQPLIPAGAIVELRRYDTSQPTTLDNIVVFNADSGEALFDGKEWLLKQQGFSI